MGLGKKFKKLVRKVAPRNSVVGRVLSKPLATLGGPAAFGVTGNFLGAGLTDMKGNAQSKMNEYNNQMDSLNGQDSGLDALASQEEMRRRALGQQQQKQINTFADEQQQRAGQFRSQLADSLNKQGQDTFALENPYILEDLNSRGLFTSETGRNQAQAEAMKEIALSNQRQLSGFDTDSFNSINDIRGSGLSAMLGGDQSALDTALELKKASIQHLFDQQGQQSENAFNEMLARRKSRDQLLGSILGFGGTIGAGMFGK